MVNIIHANHIMKKSVVYFLNDDCILTGIIDLRRI